jgi:hypothetical protein
MLQSYRGLHEHAFGPAESKPTNHMQDARHSPASASVAFGCDAIGMCNDIFNWRPFDGIPLGMTSRYGLKIGKDDR